MIYKTCGINITFNRIEKIKKVFIDNSSVFVGYNEPSILPIPDDAPRDIPRIIMQSEHGYSQITISPEVISFIVTYDEAFSSDWNKCEKYLIEKKEIIEKFLVASGINKIKYCGVYTTYQYENITPESNATSVIQESLLNSIAIQDVIYDINCRMTYTINDTYYVNISYENVRLYPEDTDLYSAGFLNEETLNALAVTVDVNDRFAFNNKQQYESSTDVLEKLICLNSEYIDKSAKQFDGLGDDK